MAAWSEAMARQAVWPSGMRSLETCRTLRKPRRQRRKLARFGGVAALVGGLAWTRERHGGPGWRRAAAIALRKRPRALWHRSLGRCLLHDATESPPRRSLGLAVVSALAGLAALVSDLMGEVAGVALAASSLTVARSAHAVEARSVASAAGVVDRCGHGAGARDWRHPVGATSGCWRFRSSALGWVGWFSDGQCSAQGHFRMAAHERSRSEGSFPRL